MKRASKIVDGLSQFSRATDSFDEHCDIHKILDDCLFMLKINIEDRIDINKEYTIANVAIQGNLGKLHQVFLNIINNAIQAIESTGEILVKTKRVENRVEIIITDSGCGISETNLSKIANPFYTTKQPGEGTGLGLSITFSIIKDHNGTIMFESNEGVYTTVIINLPVTRKNNE